MTVKRRPARKGGFRTLFANVAKNKKRHRAATATPAEIEGDVPNLGIARALVVILIIHVVAIAGIFVHSRWLDDDEQVANVEKKPVLAAASLATAPPQEDNDLPKIRSGDSLYTVGTGDTYENIAARFGIDESELRSANDNIPIRQGRYLRIPPKTITAVEPPEIAELRHSPEPVRVTPAVEPVRPEPALPVQPAMIETDAARQADARQAGTTTASVGGTTASGQRYKVKPGDTFWAIAQKYGTSVDKLMATNNIDNARHLRVGMDLVIPE
ncbi:peptidoglycan-binding protein lysM [Haloferula helveola]|uniref:Peptidoglycan-binding protein lysM n=2 Tax=Haloferula helveola TaxID=490095 RepID=A0ABM7RBQ1_9BACT|nr:peptidoglycan-binding protein lysM [Haloferula helveola]